MRIVFRDDGPDSVRGVLRDQLKECNGFGIGRGGSVAQRKKTGQGEATGRNTLQTSRLPRSERLGEPPFDGAALCPGDGDRERVRGIGGEPAVAERERQPDHPPDLELVGAA